MVYTLVIHFTGGPCADVLVRPLTLSFEELFVSRNGQYKDLNRITRENQEHTCIVKASYYSKVHNALLKLVSLVSSKKLLFSLINFYNCKLNFWKKLLSSFLDALPFTSIFGFPYCLLFG